MRSQLSTNPQPQSATAPKHLVPGVGSSTLRIGQTETEVRALLGRPDRRIRKYSGSYYYVYERLGVDIDFGRVGGTAVRLFFYKRGIDQHTGQTCVAVDGVQLGSSETDVRAAFGQPTSSGGPVSVGQRSVKWLCYNSGIQFDIGADGTVDIIIVFDKRQRC